MARNPHARRQGETHFEWRARLAAQVEAERIAKESIVTPEAERSGLCKEFVRHVETATVTTSYRRKSRSALQYMNERGSISDNQYQAAKEIAEIAEMIERSVASRCASMEAKVDCSGSARDSLVESLRRVRAEAAYTEWRAKLPHPRRMVIDMVTQDAGLRVIASTHRMGWKRAKEILVKALDLWPDTLGKYIKQIDREDLDRQHARLRA